VGGGRSREEEREEEGQEEQEEEEEQESRRRIIRGGSPSVPTSDMLLYTMAATGQRGQEKGQRQTGRQHRQRPGAHENALRHGRGVSRGT
jgi:hypothetical protein